MQRCLQLAINGRPNAMPNPVVGAVIVHNDTIIGEGFHAVCGEAHAEVNAIRSVKDKNLLTNSTLYVSLEPCSHYGKTPPCAGLIIREGIPRVVVGMQDPFPEVSGKGVEMLRNAGVEVHVGLLEDACRKINDRFITFHTYKRPHIILKWAQTSDGFIDTLRDKDDNPDAAIISNETTQVKLHKFRSQVSGILVGTNTALKDNPSLTVRLWQGKNPVRIFIDRNLRIPDTYHLLDGKERTIVFTAKEKKSANPAIQYVPVDFTRNIIPQMLTVLYKENIQTLLVEGGRKLLNSFMEHALWDEARIETSEKKFGKGVSAPVLHNGELIHSERFGDSVIETFKNKNIPTKIEF